jgi:translation initiation factor 2B subunit (eIF-2B alpha/beta/delta family)
MTNENVGGCIQPRRTAMQWAALVEPIRQDRTAGAAELAKRAATAVLNWTEQTASMTFPTWKAELMAFASSLYAAQPAMAPLFNLANDILLALESTAMPEEGRPRVQHIVRAFVEHIEQAHSRLATTALPLLTHGARVLTFSSSSTVLAVLLEAHAQQRVSTVFCTESRPMLEGQHFARTLSSAGITVEFGVDAAISMFARRSSVALVGVDSLTGQGVVNKLGTTSLALVARHAGIPCYAIGDRHKWLPAATDPPDLARLKPAEEVWAAAPVGVTIWNAYFECTPLELFTGIIGEHGLLIPDELLRELHQVPIAQALRSGVNQARQPR